MSVIGHLEELRTRLFKMLAAFMAGSVAAWFLYERILALLIRPLERLPVAEQIISRGNLIFTAPTEAFFIRLKITAFAGLVFALPVILWQLWRFVTPGLERNEKRYAVPFVVVSMALFLGGVFFAFATLPRALEFLASFSGADLVLLPRASEYLSFVLVMIAAFGITFEFPLVLLALTLVGVLTTEKLRRARKMAFITMLIVAALVTPTQDPFTLMMMAIPLALLYELTILVARLLKR